MATLKQQKVVENLTENYRTKGELLAEAGYSESTTKQPSRVLEGRGIQELIAKADEKGLTDELCVSKLLEAVNSRNLSLAVQTVNNWLRLKFPAENKTLIDARTQTVNNYEYTPEQELEGLYEALSLHIGLSIDEIKKRLSQKTGDNYVA